MELKLDFNKALELISNKLLEWAEDGVKMLPNLALAILVIVLFYFLGKLVRSGIHKIDQRFNANQAIMKLVANVAFLCMVGLGIFAALSVLQLDKTVTSLLAGAGIIGLALGFAFQETAANFLAGVLMAFRKPIRIGDTIETNGIFGKVIELNLRATILRTFQGQDVIVPNKEVLYKAIHNYTSSGVRRLDLAVGVSYGDSLDKVKEVTLAAIKAVADVDDTKDINIWFEAFGDSSINLTAAVWMKAIDQASFRTFRSDVIMSIKRAYDRNVIVIPFPIRTLDFGIKGGASLAEMPLRLVQKSQDGDGSA